MDGRRFDGIARNWGGRVDRRGTLRAAGAGLLAALWSIGGRSRAVAQRSTGPVPCAGDDDCRDETGNPCLGAICSRGFCQQFIVDCAPGYVCCANGTCCPETAPALCVTDTDCGGEDPCASSRCQAGICVTMTVACAPGFTCCGNGACCAIVDRPLAP